MFEQEIEILNKINKKLLPLIKTQELTDDQWALLNLFNDNYKKAIANIFKIQEKTFYFVLADWKEEESGEMFVDSELIFEIDEENLDCLRFISLFDFKREFDLELDKKDLFKTKGFENVNLKTN